MLRLTVLCIILHLCRSVPTETANCDMKGVNLYRAIGCPKEGNGCDAYKNCEYKLPYGHCLYQGRIIKDGEDVKSVVKDSTCNFGCKCRASANTTGEYLCAQGQCGYESYRKEACYLKYTLDECCPKEPPICGEAKSDITCKVGEAVYKEGQRFSPKDKCMTCICTKDFKDDFSGPDCRPTPCDVEIRHAEHLAKSCAPLYFVGDPSEALCCPLTFVCPSDQDEIDGTEEHDGACRYGEKKYPVGTVITTTNGDYGKVRRVTCHCEAPPLFTCTMSYH